MLALAVVAGIGALLLLRQGRTERLAVDQVRRELRQQGFKIDLAEFDFSTTPELRARAHVLTNADPNNAMVQKPNYPWRSFLVLNELDLLTPVGSNAVLVVWSQATMPPSSPLVAFRGPDEDVQHEDVWIDVSQALGQRREELDAVCAATLSGPIRFELDPRRGRAMQLRHLAILRNLSQTLGVRSVLDLHDQKPDIAWSSLMACVRLTTAWTTEPVETSQMVRCNDALVAYGATWQALQFQGWRDDQLAALQHEWESAEFIRDLPEIQAFARASNVNICQHEREQPIRSSLPWGYLIRNPTAGLNFLRGLWRQLDYRQHGTYEDERMLMVYHRDREVEWKRAVEAPTWQAMRELPGVTNQPAFQTKHPSSLQSLINMGAMNSRLQSQGKSLLALAAETETRRRLAVTAIALERYRLRHGAYPRTLAELAPAFLKTAPLDFMDGQPLRYRATEENHFVLYSVGLNCVDDDGKANRPALPSQTFRSRAMNAFATESDLAWPRAATSGEAAAQLNEQKKLREAELKRNEMMMANEESREESDRQARVQVLLDTKTPVRITEPKYEGQLLAALLRNPKSTTRENPSIDEVLTVKQVITGQEPDLATFEVPANYEAVFRIGNLELLVDSESADLSKSDGTYLIGCTRATNGNCRLVWNTGSDAPGAHALQAKFSYSAGSGRKREFSEITGPVTPFYSSNLCQFVTDRCSLTPRGLVLYARLPESNGSYSVDLLSPKGAHLKTVNGATTNGVIEIRWDRIDDRGQTNADNSVDSLFRVTLPESGRSLTQRGP